MKKELIKNYVNKLTKQDIINYLSHECTPASNEEIDMIYSAIKNAVSYTHLTLPTIA